MTFSPPDCSRGAVTKTIGYESLEIYSLPRDLLASTGEPKNVAEDHSDLQIEFNRVVGDARTDNEFFEWKENWGEHPTEHDLAVKDICSGETASGGRPMRVRVIDARHLAIPECR